MATATATTKTTKAAKAATQAQPAPITPPKGYVGGQVVGATPKQLGIAPSAGYPQGNATLRLAALPANAGAQQQANHAAVLAALGGSTGTLATALANGATRRHVRRLVRAGLLYWQA